MGMLNQKLKTNITNRIHWNVIRQNITISLEVQQKSCLSFISKLPFILCILQAAVNTRHSWLISKISKASYMHIYVYTLYPHYIHFYQTLVSSVRMYELCQQDVWVLSRESPFCLYLYLNTFLMYRI